MPLKSKRSSKPRRKAPLRRKAAPRRRTFRPAPSVIDFASLTESHTITPPGGATNFVSGTMYGLNSVQLQTYARAFAVAQNYQHYKIKRIQLIVKPSYDTFQQGAGAAGKMRLYWLANKSGSVSPLISLENMKQMGCKPLNLDEKPIKISWRPSVLVGVQDSTIDAVPAKYQVSPWLSTGVNNISHFGLYFYVDQTFVAGTQFQCELVVDFQFKKPLVKASSSVAAQEVTPALTDNSPDGIVGGNDVIVLPST